MEMVSYNAWCDFERGVTGKTYKAGCCYVALSASSEKVNRIDKDTVLEDATRWCVFIPKKYPNCFYELLSSIAWPLLYAKCNQGINFKFEHIKFLEFPKVESSMLPIIEKSLIELNQAIFQVERDIQLSKDMKEFFMDKMFI
jgi:hypothetical protein